MKISQELVFKTAVDLGLVVSICSTFEGKLIEWGALSSAGNVTCSKPDLQVVRAEATCFDAVALTGDGQAFLDLVKG